MEMNILLDQFCRQMKNCKNLSDPKYSAIIIQDVLKIIPYSQVLHKEDIIITLSRLQVERGLTSKEWDCVIDALQKIYCSPENLRKESENVKNTKNLIE